MESQAKLVPAGRRRPNDSGSGAAIHGRARKGHHCRSTGQHRDRQGIVTAPSFSPRRAEDGKAIHFSAINQLPQNHPRLDGLTDTNIIGDEKTDGRRDATPETAAALLPSVPSLAIVAEV